MQEFERAPEKPHDIIPIARQLLQQPDIAVATTFCERILQFQPWPQPPEGAMERFQNDREMQWQHGGVPLADS
jgi:hypothetical protein